MIRSALLFALLAPLSAFAAEPELVFIAPTNHTMPLARFQDGALSGGLLKDLGEAIAERLGRHARFVSVPSKRVPLLLASGAADSLCYALPEWLDGHYQWSEAFIPNAAVVVARADAPHIAALGELADQAVGTVSGYRYPDLEAALGTHFVRDNASSTEQNLLKLETGRMRYAIVERNILDYTLRREPALKLRADLVFASFKAQCALSPRAALPLAQFEHAIATLIEDGSIGRMLARYQ